MRPRVLLAALALLLAPAAGAEVWQWTDGQGVIRYTPDPSRVPSDRRSSVVKVTLDMPQARATPAEAEPGAPEDALASDPFNAPERARNVEVTEVPEPAWEVSGPPDTGTTGTAAATGAAATASAAGGATGAGGGVDTWALATPVGAGSTAERDVGAAGAGVESAASAPPVSSPPPPSVSSPAPQVGSTAPPPSVSSPPPQVGSTAPPPSDPGRQVAAATAPAVAAAPSAASPSAGATAAVAAAGAPAVDPWTAVAAAGAAGVPPPAPAQPAPLSPEQRARRDELEALIARDQEALKVLLSDTALDEAGFEESAELREIAQRLPALQAELRALKQGQVPEASEAP